MRHRERRHRPDERPPVPHQQDQREDEHQVVDPAQDMVDPEREVGRDQHPSRPCGAGTVNPVVAAVSRWLSALPGASS